MFLQLEPLAGWAHPTPALEKQVELDRPQPRRRVPPEVRRIKEFRKIVDSESLLGDIVSPHVKEGIMRRFGVAGVCLAVALLVGSSLKAGFRGTNSVSINLSARATSGAVGPARASADGNQYIGCFAYVFSSGSEMFCEAQDVNGTSMFCSSTDPRLVALAPTISSISSIFVTWDANNTCTALEIAQVSFFPPMVP
jgi:hypothetical protein